MSFDHLNEIQQSKVAVLIRRRDHLARRIESSPRRDLSYDRAEVQALEWALDTISGKDSTHGR